MQVCLIKIVHFLFLFYSRPSASRLCFCSCYFLLLKCFSAVICSGERYEYICRYLEFQRNQTNGGIMMELMNATEKRTCMWFTLWTSDAMIYLIPVWLVWVVKNRNLTSFSDFRVLMMTKFDDGRLHEDLFYYKQRFRA